MIYFHQVHESDCVKDRYGVAELLFVLIAHESDDCVDAFCTLLFVRFFPVVDSHLSVIGFSGISYVGL